MQNRLSFALHPLMLAQGPLPARPLAETPAQRWELAVWLRGPRAGPFSQPPASWTRCGDLKAATGAGCLARSLERPAAPGAAALCRAPGGPVGRAPGAAGRGAHGTAGAGSQPSPGGFSAWARPTQRQRCRAGAVHRAWPWPWGVVPTEKAQSSRLTLLLKCQGKLNDRENSKKWSNPPAPRRQLHLCPISEHNLSAEANVQLHVCMCVCTSVEQYAV